MNNPPPPNCTLVTACYDLNKYNPKCRTTDECLKLIDPLLQLPVYMIIFGSRTTIPRIKERREQHGLLAITEFIQIEIEDIWTYQFLSKVKSNRAKYWPTRDERTCSESHLVCCNKFDFVLEAITINPFSTTHFGWIDAYLGDGKGGLRICENYTPNIVPQILYELQNTDKFHIQILNCNDKKFKEPHHKHEFYEKYRWVVCGGFFLTESTIGTQILSRLKENFVETTNAGYGHGEEMLYLEILDEFYPHICRSYGDYGQILNNFIYPTRNIEYVYHTIIKNFKNAGQEREYQDACGQLKDATDRWKVHIDKTTYKSITLPK
jgi:hypothetical protein